MKNEQTQPSRVLRLYDESIELIMFGTCAALSSSALSLLKPATVRQQHRDVQAIRLARYQNATTMQRLAMQAAVHARVRRRCIGRG